MSAEHTHTPWTRTRPRTTACRRHVPLHSLCLSLSAHRIDQGTSCAHLINRATHSTLHRRPLPLPPLKVSHLSPASVLRRVIYDRLISDTKAPLYTHTHIQAHFYHVEAPPPPFFIYSSAHQPSAVESKQFLVAHAYSSHEGVHPARARSPCPIIRKSRRCDHRPPRLPLTTFHKTDAAALMRKQLTRRIKPEPRT